MTDDLEIQGHMILHLTFPISATKHAVATNLFFILIFYGSGNSFQLLPNAWPWRMIMKFKFTWSYGFAFLSYCTCWNSEFVSASNIVYFIPTTAKHMTLMDGLEIQGHVILH